MSIKVEATEEGRVHIAMTYDEDNIVTETLEVAEALRLLMDLIESLAKVESVAQPSGVT